MSFSKMQEIETIEVEMYNDCGDYNESEWTELI